MGNNRAIRDAQFLREAKSLTQEILEEKDGASEDFQLLNTLRSSGDSWTEPYSDNPGNQFLLCNGLWSHSSIGSNEIGIANAIRFRQDSCNIDIDKLRESIKGSGMVTSQISAILTALGSKIACLNGGPGTGKTTCMKAVSKYFGENVLLVSPTGMGAKRLQQSTGLPCSTVHRALGYSRGEFRFNEQNKLDYDHCIVDESSMLGISTAYALIKALREDCTILFVGDFNQLPSVEPGNLFQDLCEAIPTATLTEVFRSDPSGPIGLACSSILNGKIPQDHESGESYFKTIDCDTGVSIRMIVNEINLICEKYGSFPHEVRICTNTNEKSFSINSAMLRHFPKIIPYRQTRNDYKIGRSGIFNGAIGFSKDGKVANFEDEYIEITKSMEISYCVTIHSIQGCESDSIIFVCPKRGGDRLTRNLIYTAISRSKKRCLVVGDIQSFFSGISKEPKRRKTLLPKLITGKAKYEE